jgi:hypothetical protein
LCGLLAAVRRTDRRSAVDDVARELGWSVERATDSPSVLVGDTHEMVDQLEERRARFGISYVIAPKEGLDALAPVIDRLAGT